MKIVKTQEHPQVVEAQKRLDAAQRELEQAEREYEEARMRAEEAKRHAIEMEALAEIGEAKQRDATAARSASDRACSDVAAAELVRDRKREVVKLLVQRVSATKVQVWEEQRREVEKAVREHVDALLEACAEAEERNAELLTLLQEFREANFEVPGPLCFDMQCVSAAMEYKVYESHLTRWAKGVQAKGYGRDLSFRRVRIEDRTGKITVL